MGCIGLGSVQAQSIDPGGGVFLPSVSLLVTEAQTTEPSPTSKFAPGRFALNRSGDASRALNVFLKFGGTATPGLDYLPIGDFVTMAEGVINTEIIVSPLDDNRVEGDEVVAVTIVESPAGLVPAYVIDPEFHSGRIVIHDNDEKPILATLDLYSPVEGQRFGATEIIPIQVRAVDPSGYLPRVEFYADNRLIGVSELNFLVAPKPGTPIEHRFEWSSAPSGPHILSARASRPEGQIIFSKPVEIVVGHDFVVPVASITVNSFKTSEPNPLARMAPISFTVHLTPPPVVLTRVWLRYDGTAKPDSDYTALAEVVDFRAGETAKELTVFTLSDELAEGPEIIRATLLPSLLALPVDAALPPSYIVSEFASQAMIVIGDDDKGAPTSRLDLVQPVAGEIFGAGQEIHLEALGVTVDGELDRGVDFYAGDKLIGSSPPSLLLRPTIQCLPSSHRIVWKDAPSGVHTLSARYTLPMGEKIISPPISIRVKGCDLPVVSVVHVPTPYALPDTDYVPGYFLFERTGSMDLPLHVFFELGGTATPGVDYESVGRQVVIPAGESSVALTFKAIDDKFPEGRESIVVRLAMPGESLNQPYPHEYRIDPQHAVAEVLMFDNDLPSEVASLEWSQPREGDSFSFGQSIELIVVAVDKLADIRRVEFYDNNTLIGVSEHLTKDAVIPGRPRTHSFIWKGASLGGHRLLSCALDSQGRTVVSKILFISVSELPTRVHLAVVAKDPVAWEVDPSTGKPDSAVFTIKRVSGPRDVAVAVYFSLDDGSTARNGVDYLLIGSTILLPKGADSVDIEIVPIPDKAIEGDEIVVLRLEQPRCIEIFPPTPDCYLIDDNGTAHAVIHDSKSSVNLPPIVKLLSPTQGAEFVIGEAINIGVVAVDPDGSLALLEFFADKEKIGEIILPNPHIAAISSRENFRLTWAKATIGNHVMTVRATDDEQASTVSMPIEITVRPVDNVPVVSVIAWDAHAVEPSQPGELNTGSFQIRRTGSVNGDLVVWLNVMGTAEDGKDYEALPKTLTLPAGRSSVFLTVTPIDDHQVERSETVTLVIVDSPVVPPIPPYRVGKEDRATVVIADSGWIFPGGAGYCITLPNGLMHVCFAGADGSRFRFEVSEDLAVWTTVAYGTALDGAVHFIDQQAPQGHRFYRSTLVQPGEEPVGP